MTLLLTCEHAGNRIPSEYAALFKGAESVLASHRGWDIGALDVTRHISRKLNAPFHHVTWSRLLVEANRSSSNPRIWSRYTAGLSSDERQIILEKYWRPHRQAVIAAIRDEIRKGGKVLHVGVHSFTPSLNGEIRNADIGLLYDPGRPSEKSLCLRWERALNEADPNLRVRRNYPYLGKADGLTAWLRREFPDRLYMGVEFEFNQAMVGTANFASLKSTIVNSMKQLLK